MVRRRKGERKREKSLVPCLDKIALIALIISSSSFSSPIPSSVVFVMKCCTYPYPGLVYFNKDIHRLGYEEGLSMQEL